jgi:hypothetical protein
VHDYYFCLKGAYPKKSFWCPCGKHTCSIMVVIFWKKGKKQQHYKQNSDKDINLIQ